jgi:hypothetical protein
MFENKNKNKTKNDKISVDQNLVDKVNSDLLVRNMPSQARLNGANFSSSPRTLNTGDSVLSTMAPKKNNHQIIGILIIVGGFVLIGGLVYLSYVYIIKPQVFVSTVPVANKIPETTSIINMPRATTTDLVVATTSLVATVTPTTLDLASSSASSTITDASSTLTLNLPPILDSDNDGLNDSEEAVLGTNPNLADSNNNGYQDLVEITNNYDPAGSGKLNTNKNLATYTDKVVGYTILYPKDWIHSSLSNDSIVIFNAPDDSIIQVSVQDNSDKQSILNWYSSSFPDATVTNDMIQTTATWDGIAGSDNLNFYLTDKNKKNIYMISYVPAITGRVVYPNIFKLMINSLTIK